MEPGDFVCPECGSREADSTVMVETVLREGDPWSGVLQRITCRGCGREIPAHLGELWDGISVEQARSEWREVYRER